MRRPRLLDLFCGAGGASMGYHRAGFEVVGVDIASQPRYPFAFHQADALTFPLEGFDVIHASPPCQAYCALRGMWNARDDHPDLLACTRERLRGAGVPYVIENVPGAPFTSGTLLCGSMFGLGSEGHQLRRHRVFEVWPYLVLAPACVHRGPVLGIYGDHARIRRRLVRGSSRGYQLDQRRGYRLGRQAMDIDWMTWKELSQAIPPAYTQWIGAQLRAALEREEQHEPQEVAV